MTTPPLINGRLPTPHEIENYKAREAVEKHLGLPDKALNDWTVHYEGQLLGIHTLPSDSLFGPRKLFIVRVGKWVRVLRVMTSPLQREFSVYEEAVL